jgi:hypothetical protein
MRESSGGGPIKPQTKDTETRVEERKSDATSKQTVRDFEEDEQGSKGANQRLPAPDGSPDPDLGSRPTDRSDKGGPM